MTTPTASSVDTGSEQLMLLAAEWRLLGLLFERPVAGWARQVAEMAAEIRDPDLRAAALEAQTQASVGLYDTTFGPGGPAPPREVSYRPSIDTGSFLAELLGAHRAFGFHDVTGEPPDHVAVEAGFVSYLFMKQLYARQAGLDEQAAIAAEAMERFTKEHLPTLAEPLARALENSGVTYLSHAAASLLRRVGPRRTAAIPGPDDGAPTPRVTSLPMAEDNGSGCTCG